jgi:hypothetical protein
MAKSTTNGQCLFCKGTFSKQTMTKHLEACEKRKASKQASASPQRVFHLLVEGRHAPEYWIHLEAAVSAKLENLDRFLRGLWLECCGHLSAFTIAGQTYASSVMDEFGDKNMKVQLGKILHPKMNFSHEYDFGTTTDLTLKVVAERESAIKPGDVMLLARNDPPFYPCNECGENATQVCCQCVYEGEGWVCDDCAEDHECGEEMLLPVVNSPRVGMCAYSG